MGSTLTSEELYKVLKDIFPAQNDFYEIDYKEELEELFLFGINTKFLLEDLLKRHFEEIMTIDSEELDEFHIKSYISEFGEDYVLDKVKNKYWFAFSALLRIGLELEFEEKYINYANKRDGI
ncbi:hypothetical protein [Empedobacter tilapiae]